MKVRVNTLYRFDPTMIDRIAPPYNVIVNDIVRVVNLYGCPKANTMNHCHVEHLGGEFAGLVCCNSLIPLTAEEKKYVRRVTTPAKHRTVSTRYNLDILGLVTGYPSDHSEILYASDDEIESDGF